MKITVLVPTFKRPDDLCRCLLALGQQQRLPDQVLVVVRDIDTATQQLLKDTSFAPLAVERCTATVPGQVAALNTGLEQASGDIIAITDDDATPHPDWLRRIEMHFTDSPTLGGVGGRDWVYLGDHLLEGRAAQVGKISWFGRVAGNHHLGSGEAQEVDLLKGANMSYRRAAIGDLRFDSQLRGSGAQVHNDLAFSAALKRRGWRLLYDPAVAVNHYPAQRFDEDARDQFSAEAQINAAHNETLILLGYLTALQRLAYLLWGLIVGTRVYPGVAQLLRLWPQEGVLIIRKFLATQRGRWQGLGTWVSQAGRVVS